MFIRLCYMVKQINTRPCDLSDRSKKREERAKRRGNNICLTSYTAWWRRVEKEEKKFYREIEKENIRREEKMKELKEKRKGKEDFIRKFFPTCESSPGGTQIIVMRKPLDVSPVRGRGSGKNVSGRSYLFPARTNNFPINFTFNNSRTVSQNEQRKKTSFEVFGEISRLSTVLKTDQSQKGTEPGDENIRDG